jgi:hypothetical protein
MYRQMRMCVYIYGVHRRVSLCGPDRGVYVSVCAFVFVVLASVCVCMYVCMYVCVCMSVCMCVYVCGSDRCVCVFVVLAAGSGGPPRLVNLVPYWLRNMIVESQLQSTVDLRLYNLMPKHHILSAHPSINGDLIGRVNTGVRTFP